MTPRSDWGLLVPVSASTAPEALFTSFGGRPAVAHCLLDTVLDRPVHTVVAVAEPLHRAVAAVLDGHPVTVVPVPGPATRTECVAAGLRRMAGEYVLVHDVRRALAPAELAGRVLDGLRGGADAVVPALALVDSVKSVGDTGTVLDTVDRSTLWAEQYPRGFRRALLETAAGEGVPHAVIDGHPDAFVLEFPRDALLANAIHACRLAGQR